MAKISFEKSSGNVFADIGFKPAEAAELTAKSTLIIAIGHHRVAQTDAAGGGAALWHGSADAF